MKKTIQYLVVVLAVFFAHLTAASQCSVPQQCQGYPGTWNFRKLSQSSYRLEITGANNVRRSDQSLIPENVVRSDVISAIGRWLNAVNSSGEVLRISESEPSPYTFTVTFLYLGYCGNGEANTLQINDRAWWSSSQGGPDLYTTLLHEMGHCLMGGGHWGSGVMGLAQCDETVMGTLGGCESLIALNAYNPCYQVTVKNDFGNGIGGGSIIVDSVPYNDIPQDGKVFSWRQYNPTHTITAVDYQEIPENNVLYVREYQNWRDDQNILRAERPVLSFDPSGGAATYTASFLKLFNITFADPIYVEQGGSGAYYTVEGEPATSTTIRQFTSKQIAAIPPEGWIFLEWNINDANKYTNPRPLAPEGHVYDVQATFKAHLGASSPSALSTNQQRKVELVGINNLWLVYESANQVWSLTSTNFGTAWGAEQLLSTNAGTNSNPSTGSRFFSQPYIVWHGLNGGINTIWVKTPFASSPHEVATTSVHSTIAPAPVVGEHEYASGGGNCGPFTSYLESFVAWTASSGIQLYTSIDLGNTWSSAFSLSNFFRPSFASGSSTHLSFDNGGAVYLMSRVTTTGSILPLILEPDERECYQTFWTSSEMVPSSRSPQTVFSGNSQVSGCLYDDAALVAWQMHEDLSVPGAEEPQAEEMNAVPTQEEVTDQICTDIYSIGVQRAEYDAVRQRYVWHPAAKFSSCSPYTLPTVSSYSATGAVLLWSSSSHVLQATSDDAGIKWSSISNLSDGGNPNLAFGSNKYIYSELTGPPYRLNLGEGSSLNFRGGIAGEGTREIGFGSGNAWLSVEIPQMVIKTTHSEMIPIPFAVSDDSAFLPTADNLEEYLKTARMQIPEDADSVFFGLLVRSKNAAGLSGSGVPLRLHLRFTPNYGTSRYTAARWRLERNHNLNRMFRLPVAALRGRTIEFSVTLQGIERTRENLYANALVKHRPESPSQNSPMSKPAGEGSLLAGLPTDFGLAQNFPNPFNPTTVIKYQLPRDSHVTLKVFDVLGREIKILVDGVKQAGYHEVSLDASQLASGMYMYALKAGEFTSVKKLILLR